MIREDLEKTGYNKEEEYFYRHNRELIEKRRKQLDLERAARHQRSAEHPYWGICPKCGGTLHEEPLAGIQIDRCAQCHGTFFDAGELELLLESQSKESFLSALRHRFQSRRKSAA